MSPVTAPEKPQRDEGRPTPGDAGRTRLRKLRAAAGGLMKKGAAHAERTARGTVHIGRIDFTEDGEASIADVWIAGSTEAGERHYRIVNPPTLVPDALGDVVIAGERYREDPIAAIALAIASNGGARKERRRRKR